MGNKCSTNRILVVLLSFWLTDCMDILYCQIIRLKAYVVSSVCLHKLLYNAVENSVD